MCLVSWLCCSLSGRFSWFLVSCSYGCLWLRISVRAVLWSSVVTNESGIFALLFSKWSIFVVPSSVFVWLLVIEDVSVRWSVGFQRIFIRHGTVLKISASEQRRSHVLHSLSVSGSPVKRSHMPSYFRSLLPGIRSSSQATPLDWIPLCQISEELIWHTFSTRHWVTSHSHFKYWHMTSISQGFFKRYTLVLNPLVSDTTRIHRALILHTWLFRVSNRFYCNFHISIFFFFFSYYFSFFVFSISFVLLGKGKTNTISSLTRSSLVLPISQIYI